MCKEGMGYGTRVNTERNENHKKNNNAQFFKIHKILLPDIPLFQKYNLSLHYFTATLQLLGQ